MNKKFSIKKNTTALISSFNPYTFVIDDSKRILRKTPHELNEKYSNLFGNIDKCKINFEIYKNFFGVHYKPYLLKDVLAYVCCLFHKNVEYGYT